MGNTPHPTVPAGHCVRELLITCTEYQFAATTYAGVVAALQASPTAQLQRPTHRAITLVAWNQLDIITIFFCRRDTPTHRYGARRKRHHRSNGGIARCNGKHGDTLARPPDGSVERQGPCLLRCGAGWHHSTGRWLQEGSGWLAAGQWVPSSTNQCSLSSRVYVYATYLHWTLL